MTGCGQALTLYQRLIKSFLIHRTVRGHMAVALTLAGRVETVNFSFNDRLNGGNNRWHQLDYSIFMGIIGKYFLKDVAIDFSHI